MARAVYSHYRWIECSDAQGPTYDLELPPIDHLLRILPILVYQDVCFGSALAWLFHSLLLLLFRKDSAQESIGSRLEPLLFLGYLYCCRFHSL